MPKRYTNYNWRHPGPEPAAELAAAAARTARCQAGEHDVTEVPANRVVYTPGAPGHPARRRETGERYCTWCSVTIAAPVTVRCPRCTATTRAVAQLAADPDNPPAVACTGCGRGLRIRLNTAPARDNRRTETE